METIENLFNWMLSNWWNSVLFFFLFFCFLYFSGTYIASGIITSMTKKHKLYKIFHGIKPHQIRKEIGLSLLSIFIFSLQAIPFQILFQRGIFKAEFVHAGNCLWEIPLLFIWNEIHFYVTHWLLHRKWFFKKVHYVHHLSKEPTVYSIFSFHWLEAFLLGTVIFFPLFFHSFHILSILSLPIMSLFLNIVGHCNHEVKGEADVEELSRFTFRHSMHHKWSRGNYGFMLPYLDQIFKTNLPKTKK